MFDVLSEAVKVVTRKSGTNMVKAIDLTQRIPTSPDYVLMPNPFKDFVEIDASQYKRIKRHVSLNPSAYHHGKIYQYDCLVWNDDGPYLLQQDYFDLTNRSA